MWVRTGLDLLGHIVEGSDSDPIGRHHLGKFLGDAEEQQQNFSLNTAGAVSDI
jgi:hypothetical protein